MGTRKTKTELDALYADNVSGAISAADLRDLVETMKQPWGELNFGVNAGSVTTLSSAAYTAATFPVTALNAGSLNVTKVSGTENGLKYTGTPSILAYVYCHFQFSTENDNVDTSIALYKNAAIASANTEFRLTPTLSGYGAATSTTATDYRQNSGNVTLASNASPIVLTTSANHGLTTGDQITVASVVGETAANGTWIVEWLSATTVGLRGTTGTIAYTSGGTWAEVDASGPRPAKGSHSGSIGQIVTLATNDTIKLYVKNADWTTTDREDNIRIDNAILGLYGIGVV